MGGMRRMRRSVARAQNIPWRKTPTMKVEVTRPAIITRTEVAPPTRWQIVRAWWRSWFR